MPGALPLALPAPLPGPLGPGERISALGPRGGVLPRLHYRLLDPVTGAVTIPDLPHPHRSTWQVRGFQSGAAGPAQVGSFTVPLFPPSSGEFKLAWPQYQALKVNQRIEGYLGDGLGGQPVVTGVVRELPRSALSYEVKGYDSLFLLESQRTARVEPFSGSTDALFRYALNTSSPVVMDDFSGASPVGWVTIGPGTIALDAHLGSPAMRLIPTGGGVEMRTPTAYAASTSPYLISVILFLPPPDVFPDLPTVRLALTDSTLDSGHGSLTVAILQLIQRNGRVEMDAFFGDSTSSGPVPETLNVLSRPLGTEIQVQANLTFYPAGALTTVRLGLNGQDCATFTFPTRSQGRYFYVGWAEADLHPAWCAQVAYLAATAAFQPASIAGGAQSVTQVFSRASGLELANLAATTEGVAWRKDPRAGLSQDLMSFGAIGSDQSQVAVFSEGDNLLDVSVEGNSEMFATVISGQADPGPDTAGTIDWYNIAAIRTYGCVGDAVSMAGVSDFRALRAQAQQLSALKASPMQAKSARVLIDPERGALVLRRVAREQDKVQLHWPALGLNHQVATLLGYDLDETSEAMTLYCDQWPLSDGAATLRRELVQRRHLGNASDAVSPTSGAGIFDARIGSPNLVPFSNAGTITSTASPTWASPNNLRLPFFIPTGAYVNAQIKAVFTTSGTAGVHLFQDGTDISSALGGPWAAGNVGELDLTGIVALNGTNWHELQLGATTGGTGFIHVWLVASVRP